MSYATWKRNVIALMMLTAKRILDAETDSKKPLEADVLVNKQMKDLVAHIQAGRGQEFYKKTKFQLQTIWDTYNLR